MDVLGVVRAGATITTDLTHPLNQEYLLLLNSPRIYELNSKQYPHVLSAVVIVGDVCTVCLPPPQYYGIG